MFVGVAYFLLSVNGCSVFLTLSRRFFYRGRVFSRLLVVVKSESFRAYNSGLFNISFFAANLLQICNSLRKLFDYFLSLISKS